MSFPVTVLNGSLSSPGSKSVENIGSNSVYLTYNLSGLTTAPNVTFTIAEADPIHPATALTGGQTVTTSSITTASSGIVALTGISSSCVLVSWTVTGGSFSSANVTIGEKFVGNTPTSVVVTQATAANLNADVVVQSSGVFSHALNQDGSGNLGVNIENTPSVTSTTSTTATTSALTTASISVSSAGNNTLITHSASTTIRVFKLFLVFGGTTNATFQNGTSTALSGAIPFLANGSIVLDLDTVPWFVTTSGNDFVLNLSAGVTVSGTVYYTQS